MKKKILTIFILLLMIPMLLANNYNYSYYGNVLHSSPGYNYITHINAQTTGIDYLEPTDLYVYDDVVYMLAEKNNVIHDENGKPSNNYMHSLILLNNEYRELVSVSEFELSASYEEKILNKVNETFEETRTLYKNLFNNETYYSGLSIPIAKGDMLIKDANYAWSSKNENIVNNNGLLINNTNEIISTQISLVMTLWNKNIEMDFTVNVHPEEEGIRAKGSILKPTIEVDGDVQTSLVNDLFDTNFDSNIYETFTYLVENFENEKQEFVNEGYKISYKEKVSEDDESKIYDGIKLEREKALILESAGLHPSMFEEKYTLNNSNGLTVVEDAIYIADTNNNRVLKISHDTFEIIDAFYDVEDETFNEIEYRPSKITVDASGRMYVVAAGVYEGILELDNDGSFNRYIGVNPIKLTALDQLKRLLMTEAQRAKLEKFLPTDYTNVQINEKSFIYSTARPHANDAENMIQLINPYGIDVLKKNGYHPPMGDIMYVEGKNNYVIDGPSTLLDIAIGKSGIYSVLDAKRSRIFTYDGEGNLLYVNGDKGGQSDKFEQGIALAYHGDNLLVLDRSGTIVIYRPTEFGNLVNGAVDLHANGKFEEAAELWKDVLRLNTNYEYAYNGIGKYHLRNGEFKEAMKNFKLGHDQYYYSKAFVNYRNELIKENFGYGIIIITSLALVVVLFKNRHWFMDKRGNK